MPFILSKDLSKTFETVGHLRVENFLPDVSFHSIRESLENRLKTSPNDFKSRYMVGRDLFRIDTELKKSFLKKDFQKVVRELCQGEKVILAFDQIWDCRKNQPFFQTAMLQDIMSVSPLRLAALICLEGTGENDYFPKQPNEILFFLPWRPIPWNEAPQGQLFLMLGFAQIGAIYKENNHDPNTHLLKRLDYQTNEPLNIKTHPQIKG